MKTTLLTATLAAFIGLLGADTPVFAQNNACSTDIQNFCPTATTWKEKRSCLKQHESELSAPCEQQRQKRKAERQARRAAFHKACDADIQTYCSNATDAKEKPWEVRKCLRVNENSLSAACQAQLQKKRHRKSSSFSS